VPETLQTSYDLRVFVKDPAEAIAPQDTRAGVRWHRRQRPKRCCLTQCPVRPVDVEVFLVLEQDVPGVGSVHDQHLVQQLAADTAHEPFGDRIRVKSTDVVYDGLGDVRVVRALEAVTA